MNNQNLEMTVSEFVAILNQVLEAAMPYVTVVGELANFRVSKNRWVYFDLKDDGALIRGFTSVYQLSGPLEDGMLVKVSGSPRLHPLYGFSLNAQSVKPTGEGAIKKAAGLLEAQLRTEGLFEPERKRPLPYPPTSVGLIASSESAAFSDFLKILNARWGGVDVQLRDVQVQGDAAVTQIVRAINAFNAQASPPEVVVLTRGGGSAEDMQAFSTEQVTRAVAASRIPTLVAVGHERDVSLAELAADQRASTPSNAAELLVPDKAQIMAELASIRYTFGRTVAEKLISQRTQLQHRSEMLQMGLNRRLESTKHGFRLRQQLFELLDPKAPLQRGYALIKQGDAYVRQVSAIKARDIVKVYLQDGHFSAVVNEIKGEE